MSKLRPVLFAVFLVLAFTVGPATSPAAQLAATPHVATSPPSHQAADSTFVGFDELVTGAMAEWGVPGLAIAVVKEGEVVLSQGFGYRDVEQQLPVTPSTLFAIGSISKSFTATVLGTLVDAGEVDWDAPVRQYLPEFQLYDDVATEHMTIRDLLTHRSGLPRHDALWYGAELTRPEMIARLRYLEPSQEFRAVWQYQNLMFMTAGYLAGQVMGTTWEDLVRDRIFGPLDMNRSNFSVDDSQRDDDFAYPYAEDDDAVVRIPFRNIDQVGPAGSINSSVEEMIRYVQLHLDKGKVGAEQLLSEASSAQMQTPQMVMPGDVRYDELGHSSYGLGLMISTYRGEEIIMHGGGIDGFISLLSFMPRRDMGAIVLTNFSGNNPVPTIVTRNVYDRLLGLEPVDWVSRVKEDQAKAEEAEEEAEEGGYGDRREGTSPSHALEEYAGTYEHPAYGRVQISVAGETLAATYNDETSPLAHYHYDIFEIPESDLDPMGGTRLTFLYNQRGRIDRVLVPMEPAVDAIVFTRVADEALKTREHLERFIGEYEIGGQTLTVALQGDDRLTLSVPGQPTYGLVPTQGSAFDLEGASGYSIEFREGATGEIEEMVLHQPNGTFVATKK
jgi:CubicO group peptidase (beta-lactamase class C family)